MGLATCNLRHATLGVYAALCVAHCSTKALVQLFSLYGRMRSPCRQENRYEQGRQQGVALRVRSPCESNY
jgi:hypothetical protein